MPLGLLSALLASSTCSAPCQAPDPISVQAPAAPARLPTQDGATLIYELRLTDLAHPRVRPLKLSVVDPDTGRVLMAVAGPELARRTSPSTAGADGTQRLYVELHLAAAERPHRLENRLLLEPSGGETPVEIKAMVVVDRRAPAILGAPLDGGPWVAVHAPEWPRGHRRVVYGRAGQDHIPGRYAIDWVAIDTAGRTTRGDPDRPGDAFGYGAAVHAGADARVAAVRDDVPESNSIAHNLPHTPQEGAGNYVALDLGDGRFVFYEHLRPGSIRVKVGEAVRGGEVIGALGFTGESTGPHLHMHVADSSDPLQAEGLPFVIRRFAEIGRYDDVGQLGRAPWRKSGPKVRQANWPGYNVVVRFTPTR